MSRYIDADDVANAIYHHFPSVRTMADARGIIEEAPSIDIVFCKECIFGTWDDDVEMYDCELHKGIFEAQHYCSDGEVTEDDIFNDCR